jgi:plasmid stability protein
MTEPTVTLTLPPAVYDELQQRARQHQRRLEEEAALTLTAAVGAGDALPDDLAAAIDALATLDDETLWRVSQSQPTVEDGILLDALVDKRRCQGLSAGEERLLAKLVDRHDRVMVLRAEALALLHARGIDIGERVAHA